MLIRLEAQMTTLTTQVATNAQQSATRDARLETKIDAINGSVAKQDVWQIQHANVPHSNISTGEAAAIVIEHREMWTVYRAVRWLGVLATTGFLAQSIAVVGYFATHWR